MMDKTTLKKVKVIPKKHRFVGDILPNNDRITEETEKNLNPKEIIRAMQFADCFEGTKLLTPANYLEDPTEELLPTTPVGPGPAGPSAGEDHNTDPGHTSEEENTTDENVVAGGVTSHTADTTTTGGKATK